jgi:hypothetical protein
LLGISKRGNTYLRTLLVHAARAVILRAKQKPGCSESWLGRLLTRRHQNIAACALANHNARVAWALLAHNRQYEAAHVAAHTPKLHSLKAQESLSHDCSGATKVMASRGKTEVGRVRWVTRADSKAR